MRTMLAIAINTLTWLTALPILVSTLHDADWLGYLCVALAIGIGRVLSDYITVWWHADDKKVESYDAQAQREQAKRMRL